MNFESFRKQIESALNSNVSFELQEFHYEPYSFGNGILAYRINGLIHKFIFDGRENELKWMKSKPHQKYFGANLNTYKSFEGLVITETELLEGIKKST